MPTLIKRLTAAGLADVDYAAASLKDAAQYEPTRGIYTVSRTWRRTRALMLDAHLARLEDSARHENIDLSYDRRQLQAALRQMILDCGFGDVRFRITVAAQKPDEMILTLEPFQPPARALIEHGAAAITSSAAVRHHPAAKTSDWMRSRKALEQAMPAGIYETFLVDSQGYLLEGLSSNFFAVLNGQLRTAGAGILAGISRRIVFQICGGIIPLRKAAPRLDDIPRFSEAFLTSSSRGIMPVVEIDGIAIGGRQAGETTKRLQQAYQAWLESHLEEL